MKHFLRRSGIVAGAATALAAAQAKAVISLNFTDNDSTPTSTTVLAGSTFQFSVKLTETLASDSVSGVDYRIRASINNEFEFLSRNSMGAGDNFNSPNGSSDSALTPILLNPDNGQDLGTSVTPLSGPGSTEIGPATYEVADYSFKVLPNTPVGTYTLSFLSSGNAAYTGATYSGPPPGYNTGTFGSLGTFAVTVAVPEPASVSLLAITGMGLGLRRRKR